MKFRDKLTGEISFDGEKTSEKVVGYFAYFELTNGFSKTLYMTLDEMAKHAKRFSPSIKGDKKVTIDTLKALAGKDSFGLGWTGDFDSMALKTVLRNLLSKYGYLSIEMQNALSGDIGSDSMDERNRLVEITEAEVIDLTEEAEEEKSEPKQEPIPY